MECTCRPASVDGQSDNRGVSLIGLPDFRDCPFSWLCCRTKKARSLVIVVTLIRLSVYIGSRFESCKQNSQSPADLLPSSSRLQHGIHRPASSPDLNLIENIWALLKNNLRKQWRNPSSRPHNEGELIIAAQTTWGDLPWGRKYHCYSPWRSLNSLVKELQACIYYI